MQHNLLEYLPAPKRDWRRSLGPVIASSMQIFSWKCADVIGDCVQ